MTHHINDKQQESGAKTNESFEKVAKEAGLNPDQALDYRQVDQGRNVEPKLESTIKPKVGKKVKGKKGKQTTSKEDDKGRTTETCSFCGNNLSFMHKNYHALPGVKAPKRFKSARGVFCDDCERASKTEGQYRDFRTAVVEREDGTVANIPVNDLAV